MLTLALVVSSCGDGSDDKKSDSSDDAKKEKKNTVKNSMGNDDDSNEPSSEICECAEAELNLMTDMKNGVDMTELESKYKSIMEKCEKMGDGLNEDEMKALEKEYSECPAYIELQKMRGGEINGGDEGSYDDEDEDYGDEDYGDEDYGDEDYSIEGVEDAIEAAEGAYDDGGGNNI